MDGEWDASSNTLTFRQGATQGEIMYGIVAHELTHVMESSQYYSDYADMVIKALYGDDQTAIDSASQRTNGQNGTADVQYSVNEYDNEKRSWAYDILNGKEMKQFFSRLADMKKLGYTEIETAKGTYLIDIGNKIIETDADWDDPSVEMIIVLNDTSESNMLAAKEIIKYDARTTGRYDLSRQTIVRLYGKGYFNEEYPGSNGTYGGTYSGGKGRNGKSYTGKINNPINAFTNVLILWTLYLCWMAAY